MSSNNSHTVIIHGKSVPKKPVIASLDQIEAKFNANKNTQGTIPYTKKIETAIDGGTASGPPNIPQDLSKRIQLKRVEKGFKTQKEFAMTIKNPSVSVNEIQQMENGKMIMNTNNRTKVQAVGKSLCLGKLDLPKIV